MNKSLGTEEITSENNRVEPELSPGGDWLNRNEGHTRVFKQLADDGLSANVYKRYRAAPSLRWRSFLRKSRAQREYENLRRLQNTGLPCVEPVSVMDRRRLGCVLSSEIVTRYVPSTNLAEILWDQQLTRRQRRCIATDIGRLLAVLHTNKQIWLTAQPRNLLSINAGKSNELQICDTPYAVYCPSLVVGGELACIDLYSMAFKKTRRREFTRSSMRSLLIAYCSGDRLMCRRLERRLARRRKITHQLEQGYCRAWYGVVLPGIKSVLGRLPVRRWGYLAEPEDNPQ